MAIIKGCMLLWLRGNRHMCASHFYLVLCRHNQLLRCAQCPVHEENASLSYIYYDHKIRGALIGQYWEKEADLWGIMFFHCLLLVIRCKKNFDCYRLAVDIHKAAFCNELDYLTDGKWSVLNGHFCRKTMMILHAK